MCFWKYIHACPYAILCSKKHLLKAYFMIWMTEYRILLIFYNTKANIWIKYMDRFISPSHDCHNVWIIWLIATNLTCNYSGGIYVTTWQEKQDRTCALFYARFTTFLYHFGTINSRCVEWAVSSDKCMANITLIKAAPLIFTDAVYQLYTYRWVDENVEIHTMPLRR